MAVKTIKVDITGLDKIANAEKSISSLRNAVLGIEKDLKGMSGRRNSPLSFYIELKFNEDKVKQDYLKIKNMIENIPINVRSKEGRVDLKQSNRIPRDSGYVRVRDQDYQSWRNLHKAIGDVSTASLNLMSTMTRLGAVNPAKGLLSVFNQINSKAMELHGNLMNLVGGKLQGGLQSAISGVLSGVRSGIGQITQETENIGNAMQVFRVNMGALGFDEKEINKSMKRLGDYGKATVFDASDLLEQASTYYAYDRKDAEDIVKGISGLVAQTKDPVQGLKSVGIQVSQMLAAGKLNQQDFRFMRERFSALGASEVNDRLLALSKSKGYNTIIEATRHGDISSNEVLDILKELGNSEKFQNLVTSILTPRQALDNLKETLGNLFVFDQIDDEGNATPGALNKVYVATRDFIKGITGIVGTDTFEKYVKRLGDSIGTTIQKVNQFGKVLKLSFGNEILSTVENFSSMFLDGIKGLNPSGIIFNSINDLLAFINTNGDRIGIFLKTLITNLAEFGDTALSVATDAISGGLLDAIAGIVKVYDNIGKLAVSSGAVKTYANAMVDITSAFNKVLEYAQNLKSLQNLSLSIKDFISTVASVASNFVINTGLIDNLAQVIEAIVRTLSTVLAEVGRNINYPRAQSALKQITDTIKSLLRDIEPILEEIIRSAINVATSQAGVNFFKAVANFVQAVVNAIKQTLVSIGGSVEGGLTKLLNIVTGVVDFASKVAGLLGLMGKYVIMGFVATKFVTWATGIISSLSTVATAMSSVTNGRVTPFGGRLGGFPYEGGSNRGFYGAGADPYGGMLYPLGADVTRPTGKQQRQALWNKLRTKASSVKSGIIGIGSSYANEYNAILDAQGRPSLKTNVLSKKFRARLRMDDWLPDASLFNVPDPREVKGHKRKQSITNGMANQIAKNVNNAWQEEYARQIASMNDGIADLPKNAGKYMLSRGKASGGAFLKVTKDLAKQGGSAIVNGFKKSGVAKVGALMLGDMAIQGFNGIAQSSDWSPGVKKSANLLASTASSAITGAMIGSAVPVIGTGIGALVGGAFGAIQGIMDNNAKDTQDKLDKEAQKEARKQQKALEAEQAKLDAQYLKDQGNHLQQVKRNFYASINPDTSVMQDVENANAVIDANMQLTGKTLGATTSSLGLEIARLPENINDLYVQWGNEVRKWSDLKEQTGLDDSKLIASIQQARGAVGDYTIKLFSDTVGTVVGEVQTFTDREFHRQNSNIDTFRAQLKVNNLGFVETFTPTFSTLNKLNAELAEALTGSTHQTVEEQIKAVIKAFENNGIDVSKFVGKSLEEQFKIANNILTQSSILGRGSEKLDTDLRAEILERLGGEKGKEYIKWKDTLHRLPTEMVESFLATLDQIDVVKETSRNSKGFEGYDKLQEIITKANKGIEKPFIDKFEKLNHEIQQWGIRGANYNTNDFKDLLTQYGITGEKLQEKIIQKIREGATSIEEAIKQLEGDKDFPKESIEALRVQSSNYLNQVAELVKNGGLSIEQAKDLLKVIDFKNVDPDKVSVEGKKLAQETGNTIDKSANKLSEGAKGASSSGVENIQTSHVGASASGLRSTIENVIAQANQKMLDAQAEVQRALGLNALATLTENRAKELGNVTAPKPSLGLGTLNSALGFWGGGIIPEYHSKGLPVGIDWKSRGTDTVPTMLTPGEYVLRKKAVDSLGTNFLNNLNKYGAQALQSVTKSTIINNVYNTNNAKINQTIDNKSEYLNGMYGVDKLMRYV